jgi:hypothetical protein
MGAYYEATIEENGNLKRFNTHSINSGLKLMEHSYIGNYYVNAVLNLLDEPKRLSWVCDYTDDSDDWSWDESEEIDFVDPDIDETKFILNMDKKEYIDIEKLKSLYQDKGVTSHMIHPVPILCNIEVESMGGGDFDGPDDGRRGMWSKDRIYITMHKPNIEFTDITDNCLFFED